MASYKPVTVGLPLTLNPQLLTVINKYMCSFSNDKEGMKLPSQISLIYEYGVTLLSYLNLKLVLFMFIMLKINPKSLAYTTHVS